MYVLTAEAPARDAVPTADPPAAAPSEAPRRPPAPPRPAPGTPAPSADVAHVPVDALLEADSPRLAGVDHDHVLLLAGVETALPPIVVHRPTMRVIDGVHRLHAARLNRRGTIPVHWFDGTEREAFLLAVEANNGHGLPLTLADRRASARRILRLWPEWSDRAVAAKVGLSGKTVGVLRRADAGSGETPAVRVGCDGRARPLTATEGRLRAVDYLAVRPDASLREIARSAGISVETARDVRDRLGRGEGPLPPGGTGPRGTRAREPRGCAGRVAPADLPTVLDSLRRDPALKYSDEGRALIRWLETRIVREEESGLPLRAPAHQAPKIAAMARACAAYWEAIATELEQRGARHP
ncbi:ParB/RepB/Spo0J family partition protein [Streptomyces sp. NPDC001744]|uniref:ParB/RepB/Spo0J family partition protein n=1 Tax=Streptomyces sp. NPDC001744 TaxID=3364606 RepID=UPI0036C121BE